MGAAILDRKSWGSPSWSGSDVIGAIVTPILLARTPALGSRVRHSTAERLRSQCPRWLMKTTRRDERLCLAHERYVFAVKQFGRLSSVSILLYFKAANIGVDILNEQL